MHKSNPASKKGGEKRPRDILLGLIAGHSYRRPYSLEGGLYRGVESLVPVGKGPPFVEALHICVITGSDGEEKTNQDTVELDWNLSVEIIINGRWHQF